MQQLSYINTIKRESVSLRKQAGNYAVALANRLSINPNGTDLLGRIPFNAESTNIENLKNWVF